MKKINKNIIGIISGMTLVAVSIIPVLAKDGADDVVGDDDRRIGVRAEVRGEIKAERIELRKENMEKREDLRMETKGDREEMKVEIKTKRDELKVEVKSMKDDGATKEEIKAKIEAVRAENKGERETFRTELEAKRKTLREEIKNEIATFKEGKKVKLDEARKTQVKQRLDNAFEKLNGAINKIAGFDKRISDAIANREAKGLDVSASLSALETARQSLEEAKVSIEAVNVAVNASLDTETSKEAIKAAVQKAVEAIKNTKAKYVEVLKVLPKVEVKATAEASAGATE